MDYLSWRAAANNRAVKWGKVFTQMYGAPGIELQGKSR